MIFDFIQCSLTLFKVNSLLSGLSCVQNTTKTNETRTSVYRMDVPFAVSAVMASEPDT